MADKRGKGGGSPPPPPPPPPGPAATPAPAPPEIVVEPATDKAELNKPVPMTGGRRPSDPTDFTERKTSLIHGDKDKLILEEAAPVKKWETDFFMCNGFLLIFFVICAITIVVVSMAGRDLKEVVGPLRKP